MGVIVFVLSHKIREYLCIFQDKYIKPHIGWTTCFDTKMLCIYLIVLNATRHIFQILYSPLKAVITNESPEQSHALFMPMSDTATAPSHLGKVPHSQPAKGERSSLATAHRLLAARSSVAPSRP